MTKVKITKAMGGVEELALLSAFKAENNTYVILDGEKAGSMGLPIIYVSKLVNDKLEKINDTNEWQSAKNYLKGIINGTNFEYIKVNEDIKADEVYSTPLTLPSESALEMIKSRYVVPETSSESTSASEGTPKTLEPEPVTPVAPVEETNSIPEIPVITATPVQDVPTPVETPVVETPTPIPEPVNTIPMPEEQPISNLSSDGISSPTLNDIPPVASIPQVEAVPPVDPIPPIPDIPLTNEINTNVPVTPVMPDNNVVSNTVVNATDNIVQPMGTYTATPIPEVPIQQEAPNGIINSVAPTNIPPVAPIPPVSSAPSVNPIPSVPPINQAPVTYTQPTNPIPTNMVTNPEMPKDIFESDRETFLKACENMFDALISKYQKQLTDLNERERVIAQKEMEIEQKMQNATEHLANAEAREQVANIAHDNAQKVMDLNNFMPINNLNTPNNNQAGVI